MNQPKQKYHWASQQMAADVKVIDCPHHDPIKDFRMEPTGHYVLIRTNQEDRRIEVAICDKDHLIIAVFRGAKCQDLYEGIFRFEQEHKLLWFKDKGHMAYLGKELKKAETALAAQQRYVQE